MRIKNLQGKDRKSIRKDGLRSFRLNREFNPVEPIKRCHSDGVFITCFMFPPDIFRQRLIVGDSFRVGCGAFSCRICRNNFVIVSRAASAGVIRKRVGFDGSDQAVCAAPGNASINIVHGCRLGSVPANRNAVRDYRAPHVCRRRGSGFGLYRFRLLGFRGGIRVQRSFRLCVNNFYFGNI